MTPNTTDINDYLVTLTGHIESDMGRQQRENSDIWNVLTPKTAFPLNQGDELTNYTFKRSGPETAFTWNELNINAQPPAAASGNNAIISGQQINEAGTSYQRKLNYGYVFSSPVGLHDANLGLNWMAQLDYKVANLQGNVSDFWFDRKQDEYIRCAGHKVICQASAPPETGFDQAWYASAPTSQMTLEFLMWGHQQMMRNGGRTGLDTVQGNPTPLVLIEPEGYNQIIYNNDGHRRDLRHSSKSDILLNPLGVEDSLGSFKYIMNYKAPRYDFDPGAGTWTRRAFYSDEATTYGDQQINSLLYREARYGVAIMYHPRVMELQMYSPKYSMGQAQFNPVDWNGDFEWVNNRDNSNNVFGHTGFFGAFLASSTKVNEPELGWCFLYDRCPENFNAVACAGC